jgi:hypothetical protein
MESIPGICTWKHEICFIEEGSNVLFACPGRTKFQGGKNIIISTRTKKLSETDFERVEVGLAGVIQETLTLNPKP